MSGSEVWRPIPHAPSYEASSLGRVRNASTGRVLRLQPSTRGYVQVNLGASCRNQLVHRLVCASFHGLPPDPTAHADHRDFNRTNNTPENLRWLPARLNLGRQLRWGPRGWETLADEERPPHVVELTPEERAELDQAEWDARGW